jgi:hypothetical protein
MSEDVLARGWRQQAAQGLAKVSGRRPIRLTASMTRSGLLRVDCGGCAGLMLPASHAEVANHE